MRKSKLTPKDIRNQARNLAESGLGRQAIYEELSPRFLGRERDIADIICTVFPTQTWKEWAWSYYLLLATVFATIICVIALPYFERLPALDTIYGIIPIVLISGFACFAILRLITEIIGNFYGWTFGVIFFSFMGFAQDEKMNTFLLLCFLAVLGYAFSWIVSKKLWGDYNHTAYQTRNAQNQIIAVSKIQFIR